MTDSDAIYDYVCAKYRPASVFAYGHSLGTAAAASLGARAARPMNGVILEAGFTNAEDAYRSIGSGLPWPLNKLIRLQAGEKLAGWKPQPEELIARVKCPLLILHGTKDRSFPAAMSETLYQSAASKEKKLLVIYGAGHFIELSKPPAAKEIRDFVERYE
jgi:hypothetical protein